MVVFFFISPTLLGKLRPSLLVSPAGTIWIRAKAGKDNHGCAFGVICPGYILEVGFSSGSFFISRNQEIVSLPLPDPEEEAVFAATWAPSRLQAFVAKVTDIERAGPQSSPGDAGWQQVSRTTAPVVPPFALVSAIRKLMLTPQATYRSTASLLQSVLAALDILQDKINSADMINACWDISRKGSQITARSPKRETDIHTLVHGLLTDISIQKSLDIVPEYHAGGGRLDFRISGVLADGSLASVCVEFKHAHSEDLFHGLTDQLPAYMAAKGTDLGVYCVAWFKGRHFDQPFGFTKETLEDALQKSLFASGLHNVRFLVIDLSYREPPSKA